MHRTIWIGVFSLFSGGWIIAAQTDINGTLGKLDLRWAGLNEIVQLFGEPAEYTWDNQRFQKDNLPAVYVVGYANGLRFVLAEGKISEIRHEGPTGFRFKDKLEVGSSLETALDVLGAPAQTVSGQANAWADGVLYRDIDGRKGYCYYQRSDQNVRLFFGNYKVTALYITNPSFNNNESGGSGGFTTVTPVDKVDSYDDVRYKDLSKILALKNDLVRSLRFNQDTVWPPQAVGSKTIDWFADKILQAAINPGLGVRQLHRMGITGKGVNVAIIDQPMYLDHPEFEGKIIAYSDVGCNSKSSMHGPAVASLLVGENCGTATDAKVFYAAARSGKRDAQDYANALEWILEQNRQLPTLQKIRVVSVSAAPSGTESPFDKNNEMWDKTCRKAEVEGIMVLDCTGHHGFIVGCFFEGSNIETPASCRPGLPSNPWEDAIPSDKLFVPRCPRTTAEEYDEGVCTYVYWGQGGLSWAIPYAAGVLAMGWQVWPDATPEQMKDLLFQSAYTNKDGAKIINPPQFINAVKKAQNGRTL